MAKGKFRMKTYEVPPEKYIVIVNPWGIDPTSPAGSARNVMAWCEIMTGSNMRPNVVFTQGTHSTVIVEFPESVNIEPLLGMHRWSQILVDPYAKQVQDRFSAIYEYYFEHWDHPTARNWSPNFPTYTKIHPQFPVKGDYPSPSRCPPPPTDIRYAKQLPSHLQLTADLEDSSPVPPIPMIKSEPPMEALQANSAAPSSTPTFIPYEGPSHLPVPPLQEPQNEDVKPTLPILVKSEPVEPSLGPSGNYKPSQELLEEFSKLPAGMIMQSEPIPKVKPEPQEPSIPLGPYQPSDDLLREMSKLPPHLMASTSTPPIPSSDRVRVKPEPMDDHLPLPSGLSTIQGKPIVRVKTAQPERPIAFDMPPPTQRGFVKPEPVDDYTIPPPRRDHRALDLRRRRGSQGSPVPHGHTSVPKRSGDHEHYDKAKRVKLEE